MHALMACETFRSAFVATAKVLNLLQMWKLCEVLLAYCLMMLRKKVSSKAQRSSYLLRFSPRARSFYSALLLTNSHWSLKPGAA